VAVDNRDLDIDAKRPFRPDEDRVARDTQIGGSDIEALSENDDADVAMTLETGIADRDAETPGDAKLVTLQRIG